MWKACKTMGPPPKTMPQKVMPPSLTAPIALFVVAPCFVFGVVIRCAMKLLPCKILGDARKSRQHAVFERCPDWPKPLTLHASTPRAAPAKPLTLPAHIVMLGPHGKRAEPGFEPGTLRLLAVRSNHWAKLALMPWDNMANQGRKLVTMAQDCRCVARVLFAACCHFFFRWVRYTLAEKAEPGRWSWKSKSAKERVVAQADWFRSRSW